MKRKRRSRRPGALSVGALSVAVALMAPQAHATMPVPAVRHVESGTASWYGKAFAGRPTASGAPFNPEAMTAAHPALPFGTLVTVTNLENGLRVLLRINDRGPFTRSRIIDVSAAAARRLGFHRRGVARVRIDAQARSLRFPR